MKYRLHQVLASKSATTAGTETIDLDLSTPISRISIRMKGTNNGSTPTAHPVKMLTKIEVVDGSDVLYSLSGVEAAGLNFIENDELPFFCNEYENDIECCATVDLNFGRWLWDPNLALDPRKFRNLQLKITHNKALGGSSPDAGTLAVFAYVFEDSPPSPSGFLMSKEIYSYTMVASAHEYVDLPRDYPFRFVILQNYTTNVAWNSQFGYLKLSIDMDRRVLLNDIPGKEFIKVYQPRDKVEEDLATLGTGSAVTYYIASTYENYGVGCGRSAHQSAMIVGQPAGPTVSITNDSSESAAVHFVGYAAFGAMNLLMADREDASTWLDPAGTQSIKLDITADSSASGTTTVVTQQSRRY